jgi:hypothetical protein
MTFNRASCGKRLSVLLSLESVTDDTNFEAATEYSAEKSHKNLIGRHMGTAQRHKNFMHDISEMTNPTAAREEVMDNWVDLRNV